MGWGDAVDNALYEHRTVMKRVHNKKQILSVINKTFSDINVSKVVIRTNARDIFSNDFLLL